MMFNKQMEDYLAYINIKTELHDMDKNSDLKVLKNENNYGEPYFYFEHNCCNLTKESKINLSGEMLTQLEWDSNELYICDSEDIIYLLRIGLITLKSIKCNLASQYSEQPFDIVLSIDDGKDNEVSPSVTIRFYAIRRDNFISHDKLSLEEFIQPVLIEPINC